MAPSRPVPAKPASLKQSTLMDAFVTRADPATKRGASSSRTTTLKSDARISKTQSPPPAAKPKSKAKSSSKGADDDRVRTDVLMAIKPVHLANIASQAKNHEYRKYRLHDDVTRLWFYETRGDGDGRASITYVSALPSQPSLNQPRLTALHRHIAVIPAAVRRTPGQVPTEPPGIGNEDFNAGRKESKYGYPMLELYELLRPVTLAEMKTSWGMGGAPMGWRYVGADLWADRWGEDEAGRGGKVKKVF